VPTYQYACTDCADRSEVVQKFTDDPLTLCSSCGGRLRKVFSPVGIVFKGSGFYRTDSRSGASTVAPGGSANGSNGSSSEGSSGSDKSKESSSGSASSSGSDSGGSKNGSGGSGNGSGSPGSGSGSSGSGDKKAAPAAASKG
jgi:putative FmdB family regulatory protein